MRIAHINNMANVAWTLAQAQKRLGHEAVVYAVYDVPSRFPFDVAVRGARGPVFWNGAMMARLPAFSSFDILHVHGGMWMTQIFYPAFKTIRPHTPLVVHFHGQDARTGKGLHHVDSADAVFHSTQDLAKFLPRSEWLPSPVEVPEAPPPTGNPIPVFGHFPLRWAPGVPESESQKGTDRVIRVFRETFGPVREESGGGTYRFRGRDAELLVVAGLPHDRAASLMAKCDVVIDQMSSFHIYGVVALEAMALGRPAMSDYNPEWFPESPVVRLGTDPGRQMSDLAADGKLRGDLGRKSRAFVQAVHDSSRVARRTLAVYAAVAERVAGR